MLVIFYKYYQYEYPLETLSFENNLWKIVTDTYNQGIHALVNVKEDTISMT